MRALEAEEYWWEGEIEVFEENRSCKRKGARGHLYSKISNRKNGSQKLID
jgi:hypothetical protein